MLCQTYFFEFIVSFLSFLSCCILMNNELRPDEDLDCGLGLRMPCPTPELILPNFVFFRWAGDEDLRLELLGFCCANTGGLEL